MAKIKRNKTRCKVAAVLALGMATMPLNGCDAGAIMGIIQTALPIIQQIAGQISEDNGNGGSSLLGGQQDTTSTGTFGATDVPEGDRTLTTEEVASAATDGSQNPGFRGESGGLDDTNSGDIENVVEGAGQSNS